MDIVDVVPKMVENGHSLLIRPSAVDVAPKMVENGHSLLIRPSAVDIVRTPPVVSGCDAPVIARNQKLQEGSHNINGRGAYQ